MLRIRVKFAGAGSYEGWTRQFLLDRSQPLDELKSTIRDHTGLATHQQHLSKGKTILYDFQMPAQIPLYDNDALTLQIYDAGAASVYKAPPEQEIVVINPYGIGSPAPPPQASNHEQRRLQSGMSPRAAKCRSTVSSSSPWRSSLGTPPLFSHSFGGGRVCRTARRGFDPKTPPARAPSSIPASARSHVAPGHCQTGSESRFDELRLDSDGLMPGAQGNDYKLTVQEPTKDWQSAWNERHQLNEHLHRIVKPPTLPLAGSPRGGRHRLRVKGSQFPSTNRRLTNEMLGQSLSRDYPAGHRVTAKATLSHNPQSSAAFLPESPSFKWAIKHSKPKPPMSAPVGIQKYIYGQLCPPSIYSGRDTRDALISHWTNAPTVLSNCSV